MVRIHDCARKGDLAGVIDELNKKPNLIEMKDNENGFTPLLSACDEGQQAVMESLLARGANIEAKSNDGETSLQVAFTHGDLDLMTFLLKKGAKISVSFIVS
jgi:serine/threonine-protein phosphatase 6 regulatory ankyrin repeat subunit B